ncbi:MAG: peptidase [Candidatus Pacebacteria bacterium]|nr:peptidase [Candidatus Paceibacterota bacterium]
MTGNCASRPRHVLLVMVDGLGLPREPLADSVYGECPALRRLFTQHCVPVDASLGVDGLPQSATGQTAILTGVNAPARTGRHIQGFPTADLRVIIEQHNLFSQLLSRGLSCTFANAYARRPERSLPDSLPSVTTVATYAAFGETRTGADMLNGRAVYHDLTRQWLRAHGCPDVPTISEETAAEHLLAIMHSVDVTLFEFFLSDHAGHRGTREEKVRVLRSFDIFLDALMGGLRGEQELLLLVSDHGNIEEEGKVHTRNKVPFCAFGRGAQPLRDSVHSIADVTPGIIRLLT